MERGQPEFSDALMFGGFMGVRFANPVLEQGFREYSSNKKTESAHIVAWIAAGLFVLSAPLNFFFIGGGEFTPRLVLCLFIQGLAVLGCGATAIAVRWQDKNNATAKIRGRTLISGWGLSVVALWFLMSQTQDGYTFLYIPFFGLAMMSTASLIPSLFYGEVRALNALNLPPVLHAFYFEYPLETLEAFSYFGFSLIMLLGTVLFGLNSKRTYELALREDFLRNIALSEARDAAERADRVKSEFLATVSHELRTPLNAIMGNIRLLQRASGLSPEAAGMLDDADRAGRTMTKLVEDVLEIASTDVQRNLTERHHFRLGDLIADLEASVGVLAAEKRLRFELPQGPIASEWVVADENRLRQILINLLGNAVKFTREGRVTLRLGIGARRLRFLVVDSGVGIPADQVPNAFDTFFRGSNVATGEFRGTGLGLAIVRSMASHLGGRVALRSRQGQGTVAYGWIPSEPSPGPLPAADAASLATTAGATLRVLAVEDEPVNMTILRRLLEMDGHHVIEATTGAEAIDLFERETVDCILTDIRLPDMSGVALLGQLTERAAVAPSGHVPIYAVTANVLSEDLRRYEDAGFDGVISKPVDFPALFGILRDVASLRGPGVLPLARETPSEQRFAELLSDDDLVRLYCSTASDCARQLRAAFDAGDVDRLRYLAHRMHGAAASYGDIAVAAQAARLETAIASGAVADESLVNTIESSLHEIAERAR